ncbi:phage P2 GpU family protein [Burkholderia pseudomallei]|nr:phage P2 GpU family protein [Burkholderia pseudomallei]
MDFVKSITQAATQVSIAAERVQHVSRVYERNRAASQNTVDTLTKLATGNLTSAAELLNGASSALALSGCASPSDTARQPVATACPALPAPPAWAMVPPPMQTSTQRLRNAFSTSPATISARSTN